MLVFFVIVLLGGAYFARIYYFLYVQTDEGLPLPAAERRHKARMFYWVMLNRSLSREIRLPKQERIYIERRLHSERNIKRNKKYIREWPLATDEELAAHDVSQLQAILDARNAHCDQIYALLVELDDYANRSPERQKEIRKKIRKLRMAPLKELQDQSNARINEILTRHN